MGAGEGEGFASNFLGEEKENQESHSGNEDTEMSLGDVYEVLTSSPEEHTPKLRVQPVPEAMPKKKEARWAKNYQKRVPRREHRKSGLSESTFEQSEGKKKFWEK